MSKIPFKIFKVIQKDDIKTFKSMLKKYNIDINTDLRTADYSYSKSDVNLQESDFPYYKDDDLILLIDYAITRKAYKICKYIANIKGHELTSCAFGSLKYAIETNSIRIFNVIWKAYEDDWEVEGSAVYFQVAAKNNLKIFRYLAEKKKLPFENIPCIYDNIIFNKSYKIARYLYKKFDIKPVTDIDFKVFFGGQFYETYQDMVKKYK